MKKYLFSIVFLLAVSQVKAGAHFYVKVQPVRPKVVINAGPCPSPHHVWVDGYWVWHPGPGSGHYEWVEGCWKVPPGSYRHWEPGHWKHSSYGWYWVDGHWKR